MGSIAGNESYGLSKYRGGGVNVTIPRFGSVQLFRGSDVTPQLPARCKTLFPVDCV